jgi:hypothetical protein
MGFSVGTAVVLLSFISSSFGAFPPIPVAPPAPPPAQLVTAALVNAATFTQLIDHEIPETGTFSQRYWWSTEFWKGPGSPVVLMTPGEIDAAGYTGYLSNRTLTGLFAQTIGGAVIVIERMFLFIKRGCLENANISDRPLLGRIFPVRKSYYRQVALFDSEAVNFRLDKFCPNCGPTI